MRSFPQGLPSVNSFRPQIKSYLWKASDTSGLVKSPLCVCIAPSTFSLSIYHTYTLCDHLFNIFWCRNPVYRFTIIACCLGHCSLSPLFLHSFLIFIPGSFICVIFRDGLGEEVRADDSHLARIRKFLTSIPYNFHS